MAKVECPSCRKSVPPIPPHYRCESCNSPLNIKSNADEPKPIRSNPEIKVVDIPQQDKTVVDRPNVKPSPPSPNRSHSDTITGWLIVHTENKEPISYNLYLGDNFFGTPADGYQVDIPIDSDRYVSRCHANLKVSKDFLNRFHYELIDDGSRRPKGPSTNGTYINGNSSRLPKDHRVFLKDGDTIQIGETKLVFKTTDKSKDVIDAATNVINSDYTGTVIISK